MVRGRWAGHVFALKHEEVAARQVYFGDGSKETEAVLASRTEHGLCPLHSRDFLKKSSKSFLIVPHFCETSPPAPAVTFQQRLFAGGCVRFSGGGYFGGFLRPDLPD